MRRPRRASGLLLAGLVAGCGGGLRTIVLPPVETPKAAPPAMPQAAVVVGIETYPNLDAPARYAEADAELFARLLRETIGVPDDPDPQKDRLELITGRRATRAIIEARVEALCKALDGRGRMWFYFSGHGVTFDGRRYLVGRTALHNREELVAESLDQARLLALLSDCGEEAIVILDACFSGRDREGKPILKDTRFVVSAEDLAGRATAGPGAEHCHTAVWAASGEFAHAYEGAQHGLFTVLAAGALGGWARDGGGQVELGRSHQRVSEWIEGFPRSLQQTPRLSCADRPRVLATGVPEPKEPPRWGPTRRARDDCRRRVVDAYADVGRRAGDETLRAEDRIDALDAFRRKTKGDAEICPEDHAEYARMADAIEATMGAWSVQATVGEGLVFNGLESGLGARSTVQADLAITRKVWIVSPEMTFATSLEGDWRSILGGGVRMNFGKRFFARAGLQGMVRPTWLPGALFGVGLDIAVAPRWHLVAGIDGTWWFTAGSVVPVQGRLGGGYVF